MSVLALLVRFTGHSKRTSQQSTQSMDKKANHRCITASEFRDVSKSNEWHEYQRINVFMALVSYSVNLT